MNSIDGQCKYQINFKRIQISKHWPEIEGREISESRFLGKRTSDARFASEENQAFVF
jgi:hypothetical protein